MGLARKGSRTIRVEGVAYRWVVSPDDGYMRIVVELRDGPGQRLSVQIGYGLEPSAGAGRRITPALVRHVILAAPSRGWTPHENGTELTLRFAGGVLVPLGPR